MKFEANGSKMSAKIHKKFKKDDFQKNKKLYESPVAPLHPVNKSKKPNLDFLNPATLRQSKV